MMGILMKTVSRKRGSASAVEDIGTRLPSGNASIMVENEVAGFGTPWERLIDDSVTKSISLGRISRI
jgi:hypothetical protein